MSDFLYWDLGFRQQGDVVEITLTAAANVRLMSTSDYQHYRNGERHQYVGGYVTRSPHREPVPRAGQWFVTVDTRGLRDGTTASVTVSPRVSPQPLPPARPNSRVETAFRLGATEGRQPASAPSLPPPSPTPIVRRSPTSARSGLEEIFRNAAGLVRPMLGEGEEFYDLFVSHASEDKEAVVRELAHALRDRGVKVWYDEFTLRIGDSLRRNIDRGIARSRFGLVVLSPAFLAKNWTQYELDGLVTMSVDGRQVLLPLWHGISKDEVVSFSPSLADRVALTTATSTIEEIADEIAGVILGTPDNASALD
ncbi:MAG: DUF1883 domain-containing protein [Rhodococcus sp.]|nr:DUF1883 domain-containing protein [Rhodococcus sp. (in: high G+C Gram-positive bacteria)]